MAILPNPRYGDFYRFLPDLHSANIKGCLCENKDRSLQQIWSVFYWSPMSMFGWVLNNSKISPKMAILPHPRYGDFYRFCLFFNSAFIGPSLENEGRSLHETWSVFYSSSKSMFGWVLSKSKIWPKMAILPNPRYGDFYRFCLFFNSAHIRLSLENEERSLDQIWSVFYWSPKSMFGWVLSNSKISPKMAILPHPRYGDFYQFCLFF